MDTKDERGVGSRELDLARRIVEETGANLFLTGKAGTGKTTFLRNLRASTRKRMIVLAPSGVAAINAQGTTIHSFFQFPLSLYVPGSGFLTEGHYPRYSRATRRIIATLDLLVIDEISMVRPDLLDAIDETLRRQRRDDRPFGGVQLLLIGDLRQLSPVVRDEELPILKAHYASPYFFESGALRRAGFLTAELTEVFRQSDSRFIDILNAVREGKADRRTLDALNSRCIAPGNDVKTDSYIRLTTHNRQADAINESRLRALPGPERHYKAAIKGKFPATSYPADENLTLKPGAKVMFLRNDSTDGHRFYNGMTGRVVSMSDNSVSVLPDGSPTAIEVEPVVWENGRYVVDDDTGAIRLETDGSFSQIPLRPAWAITIHKSQGLTFDRAIIDAASAFAPGQAYVALSRCRSLEGMLLGSPLTPSAIIVDHTVNDFIDRERVNTPDELTVGKLSERYHEQILGEVFDFTEIHRRFNDFMRAVEEYVAPTQPGLSQRYREALEKLEKRVVDVGKLFMRKYIGNRQAASHNSEIPAKVKAGCVYFTDELTPIAGLVASTPRDLDNKAFARRVDNAYDALVYPLGIKMRVLARLARVDFSTAAYINIRAEETLKLESADPERKPSKKKAKAEKKPKGYSVYETVKLLRGGKTPQEIAKERSLTLGTVATHLALAVGKGELDADAVIAPATRRQLSAMRRPGQKYNEFMSRASDAGIDPCDALIYYKMTQRNAE